MTHPLTSFVAAQPLYIALRDGEENGTPTFRRNFVVLKSKNPNIEPLLIHGKEFGNAEFFRRLRDWGYHFDTSVVEGLPVVDTIAHFLELREASGKTGLFSAKHEGKASHSREQLRKTFPRISFDTVNSREEAKTRAVKFLHEISDPYQQDFKNAEKNIASGIAQADHLALEATLSGSKPYKIIVVQDSNLDQVQDLTKKDMSDSGGFFDEDGKRIYISTSLDLPETDVMKSENAWRFIKRAKHELEHAANYESGLNWKTLNNLQNHIPYAQKKFCKRYTFLIKELEALSYNTSPKADIVLKKYLDARYPGQENMSAEVALQHIIDDLQEIAKMISPFIDLRSTALAKYITPETVSEIQGIRNAYPADSDKQEEIPARIEGLTAFIPAPCVKHLFPELFEIVGQELREAHNAQEEDMARQSQSSGINQWHKRLAKGEPLFFPIGKQ